MAYLNRVQADLAGCADAGIITPEQARRASDHIAATQAAGRFKGATWIALFAGLMVAVGVVLVVSHNWDKIPAEAKMAAFLCWLGLIGAGAIGTRDRAPAVNIPLELIWFFLPAVGIGLYAQIFQLSGDPVRPYLVWLALALPIAWYSKHHAVPAVHVFALIAVLFYGSLRTDTMMSMTRDTAPLAPLLCAVVLLAAAALSHFKLKAEHRIAAVGGGLAWFYAMLAASKAVHVSEPAFLLAAAMALATLWLTFTALLSGEEAHRARPRWIWLGVVYIATFLWHEKDGAARYGGDETAAGFWLVCSLTAAAAATAALAPDDAFSRDAARAKVAKAVLVLGALLPYFGLASLPAVGMTFNILLAVSALGLMWSGSLEGRVGQINAGVASLFLLILTRFIDVFGSLLDSGLAFIASGLLLGVLAYGLHKGRNTLLEKAARSAP